MHHNYGFCNRTSGRSTTEVSNMKIPNLNNWPVLRQLQSGDPHALGHSAMSERTRTLESRTRKADRVVKSVCPYCAVGCAQLVYVKNERIVDIEGDPDSPIS